jgi:signal transduction histidine kinase
MKFTPDGGSVSLHAKRVDYASVSHLTPDRDEIEKYFARSAMGFSQFVYPPKSGIQFSVSDTGIGIKVEDQERIFNPFEQADGSTTRQFEGTGLGLSVTKSIVEMHGGAIWLESGGLNKGATFHFVLPILEKSELIS